MTAVRFGLLFLVAAAVALLVSTVLVQAGVRPRAAILVASVATPFIVALPIVLAALGLIGGTGGVAAP